MKETRSRGKASLSSGARFLSVDDELGGHFVGAASSTNWVHNAGFVQGKIRVEHVRTALVECERDLNLVLP
jgi:hypothetical protein